MKKLLLALPFALLLAACGGGKKTEKVTVESSDGKTTTSVDATAVTHNDAEDMNRKMEELKKLTPMTTEQLKALLPEELNGMKRTRIQVNSMTGLAAGSATYKINDTAEVETVVTDCAGEMGSAFYTMNYATKMNLTSESDDGYFKIVDLNGKKATEGYSKNANRYNLMFLVKDHILVNVEGRHAPLAAVRQTAEELGKRVN